MVDVSLIQAACKDAWCIASIVPVHKPKVREKRLEVVANMSEDELLRAYCKNKNLPVEMVERLMYRNMEIYCRDFTEELLKIMFPFMLTPN